MFVGVTDGQDREALTPWFVVGVTVMVLPSMVMVCQSTVSTVGGMIPSRLAVPVGQKYRCSLQISAKGDRQEIKMKPRIFLAHRS